MSTDSNFYLYKLSDPGLDSILSLNDAEVEIYINELIQKFYPNAPKDNQEKLINAYKGSFVLEKHIRISPVIQNSFTPIYTKTGLIREVVNDLYSIGSEKLAIN